MEDLVFGRRYRVTEKIGTGGMADVYKAVDEVLGRTVAVKVLRPRYAAEPNFVNRFRQEAQAAANLSSPHIVNMFDWGRDDDSYYIVMEYVRGTDLKTVLEEKGPLDPSNAADYAAQVCSALAVAHGYGIIHRDIKPQNIVLMPDGVIKVMDFGIARASGTTLTQTGSVLGTAHYVSPEQAQGRALGPASDLYSLGVVLYELTTGALPFDAETPVAVALKHVNEEPPPPRTLRPSLPEALELVILKAMRKDPSERYQTAEEMRADLRRFAAGEPVEAATAVAAASVTSVLPPVEATQAPPATARGSAPPAKKERRIWPWIAGVVFVALVAAGGAWAMGAFETTVAVPNLEGMNRQQAQKQLAAVGLALGSVEETYSMTAEEGQVVAQSPIAGERVPKETKINVVVSKGVEIVEMPDLVYKSEAEAIKILNDMGFELDPEIQRQFSANIPQLFVIKTDPPKNKKVPRGTRVTLYVSKGVETRKIPDVMGKQVKDAQAAIEKEKFVANIVLQFSDAVAKGEVFGQKPEGGTIAAVGTVVTITVSRGPETLTVPNVIGDDEAAAVKKIEDLGLNAVVEFRTTGPQQAGKVVDQEPKEGAQLRRGEQVRLYVGRL